MDSTGRRSPPPHSSAAALRALAAEPQRLRHAYGRVGLAGLAANAHVVLCAAVACLGGLLFGYDQGVVSVTLVMPQFIAVVPRIADGHPSAGFWKGFLTALLQLGACLGAVSAGYVADRFSRRGAILAGVAWFVLGSAIQTGAVNYAMLVVGRFLGGIGIGTLSMVAPLYVSEISPPSIRGVLLGLEEFCIVFGICVAYYHLRLAQYRQDSEWAWRFPFLLQIAPALLLLVGVYFLPYSPRWLATRGRRTEALAVLARLRNRPPHDSLVQAELIDILAEAQLHAEIREERHPGANGFMREFWSWVDCLRAGCVRRTGVGVCLMFFQQLVGINALIYYAPTLFAALGLSYDLSLIMAGVANLCQLLGVVLSFFFIDKIGRKPLLAFGSIGTTVCLLITAVLTALFASNWPAHQVDAWVAVSMLLVYMVVFGLSWGPVPWAMPAEIFPSSLRAKGVALSTLSNWFFNFTVGLITPPLVEGTSYGAFVFFCVFAFLSIFWVLWACPETAGVPLEQLDNVFKDRTGERDRARALRIQQQLIAEQLEKLGSVERLSGEAKD